MPELEQRPEDDDHTYLSPDEERRAARLSAEELALIDRTLLSYVVHRSRKVARVVGSAMSDLSPHHFGVPDRFYAQRVAEFIRDGRVLAEGDPRQMGCCEVWVPGSGGT